MANCSHKLGSLCTVPFLGLAGRLGTVWQQIVWHCRMRADTALHLSILIGRQPPAKHTKIHWRRCNYLTSGAGATIELHPLFSTCQHMFSPWRPRITARWPAAYIPSCNPRAGSSGGNSTAPMLGARCGASDDLWRRIAVKLSPLTLKFDCLCLYPSRW